MAEDTFDGLKDALANSLFKEEKSLKEIVKLLMASKSALGSPAYEVMLSEISLINNKIKEISAYSDRLYNKAIRDGVTALYNRAYLDEYIKTAQNVEKRERITLAYVMSDIDHFKKYNDTYNHFQGDMALRCVADAFRLVLENTLAEGEGIFTARYGGEEFCAFIENFQLDDDGLCIRLENVREKVGELEVGLEECVKPADEGYKKVSITVVGGIIKPEEHIKSLMGRVDNILKDKGKLGRNKVYIST